MANERLQKLIARAGLASRRKAEGFITAGRVSVNGKVITELGAQADPDADRIEVDGNRLRFPKTQTYLLLWKPAGVVTTASDELGRKTVIDLVKGINRRVFPVGRLDLDAEGVLLLTDDGPLAATLMHPSSQVPKVYHAKVRGRPSDEALRQLTEGVELEDGPAKATSVKRVTVQQGRQAPGQNQWVELTVTEGRNHLVKRMLEEVGHPVVKLRRVRFAHLDLEGLRPGRWRNLRRDELRMMRAAGKKGRQATRKKS